MAARRMAYEGGLVGRFYPRVPCVSVGNVGWGGSGKTPLALWLLQWAVGRGLKPALLTRGYGGDPPHRPYRVRPLSPAEEAGDEPAMMAAACPGAVVVADPKRSRSGPWVQDSEKPDLFVLDDGFQHLAAHRHADLVLLRPRDLEEEWNRVLPMGSWREGQGALERATAFLVKAPREDFLRLENRIRRRLGRFNRPVFQFDLEPRGLRQVTTGKVLERPDVGPYVLACGVADPGPVEALATRFLLTRPERLLAFPDHHRFTIHDWRAIADAARRAGARRVVCTPKDAVKLARFADGSLHAFELELTFGQAVFNPAPFPAWWERFWTRLKG